MIICGYAGIGKSHLAKNFPGVIDLESTPFEKDWDRYLKCAMHYIDILPRLKYGGFFDYLRNSDHTTRCGCLIITPVMGNVLPI